MLAIYERLTAKGIIGPFDANGRPRPFQEYPKQVRDVSGALRVVNSQREELAVAAESSHEPTLQGDDPLLAERNALAEENERLRLQLAALSGTPGAVQQAEVQPLISPKAPESVAVPVKEKTNGGK